MQVRRWLIVLQSVVLKFLFAILPLSFDRHRERFRNRTKDVILSTVLLVLYAIVGPIVCVELYVMNISGENQITNALSAFQFAFVYFFILIVQIIFIRKKACLHVLLNEMFQLKHVLERMVARSMLEFRLYTLFLVKVTAVDILMQLLALYTFEDSTYTGRVDSVGLASWLTFYAMMYFIAVIENFILVGVLIGAVMQGMVNIGLKQLARSRQGSAAGRQPSVLQLYMLHCKNEDMVKQFMETLNFPTLMLTGWYFFMIVYSVYYMYVYALEASFRGVRADEFKAYINPLVFFLYQCVQLYLLVLIPSVYTDHAKKMMRLLNYVSVNQYHHRPGQERLIEVLMVDCMQRNNAISNYGMYAMNRALLFGMIATMTSYLIILIQFHIQAYE
ncbi:gustatory and pheromone receptor 32a-like [Anopheles arabiensis]|uniref:Gustatory receptor n=1 Tax=Anopheles arabiensis TaxID=7173 RepID=A0A182II47_ANOAR|nr:gustatory and pheromone receptor 32a-like [Anopheles arabiensis]